MEVVHVQTPSPGKRRRTCGNQTVHHFSGSSPTDHLPITESGLDQTLSPEYLLQQMSPTGILADAHIVDSSEFNTPDFDLDFLNTDTGPAWQEEPPSIRPSDTVKQQDSTDQTERAGLSPSDRKHLNEIEIPSLEDQEQDRKLGDEIAKVRSWLESSSMGAELANVEDSQASTDQSQLSEQSHTPNERPLESTQVSIPQHDATFDTDSKEIRTGSEFTNDNVPSGDDHAYHGTSEPGPCDSDAGTTPPATIVAGQDVPTTALIQPSHDSPASDHKFLGTLPWTDASKEADSDRGKEQPPSSNDAITMFMRKARDIETASLTATLGSRRRSEADLDSLFSATGTIGGLPASNRNRDTPISHRLSLFTRMVPRRSNSNTKKRKDEFDNTLQPQPSSQQVRSESSGNLSSLKRVVSGPRPKSPRLDTNVVNQPSRSPTSPSQLLGSPWTTAKSVVNRVRSRSDAGQNPGIAELFARQGGPPTLRVPGSEYDTITFDHSSISRDISDTADDIDIDDDESPNSIFPVALKFGERPAAPTYEAFKAHVQKLNPRLDFFMVERIAQEQIKRHRRLLEFRAKHETVLKRGNCPSGSRCNVLGAGADYTLPATNGKSVEPSTAIFVVIPPGDSPVKSEMSDEKSSSISATFPDGIPLPPVKQLPAEFECPLCFHVKKFTKPSDWTKHVHEDVQPFTCTFPNCGEPKSFKRKADWVRHESERHRHLESWKCDVPECQHICYRKDNFVQHLVREHRYPEPRIRLGRATSRTSSAANNDDNDIVAHLVEKCRFESSQQPTDEPCRFCGILCNSWKKLTVHLAKHMEQISMPILELIGHEIPHGNSDAMFASARSDAAKQVNHQVMDFHDTLPGMARSQLPSLSVTNTTGSTYPPPNLSRGRAFTDSRIGIGAYSPASSTFMTNTHSPNISSGSDYSFTYQNSPAFSPHAPQFPSYNFTNTYQQNIAASNRCGDLSTSMNLSSFPTTSWASMTQAQNEPTGLWQEPHFSTSAVKAPGQTVGSKNMYHSVGSNTGGYRQQNGAGNQHFSSSKSNNDNMWTYDGSRGAHNGSSARAAAQNMPFSNPKSQNFASQRLTNAQGPYGDWSLHQRYGDFYSNS